MGEYILGKVKRYYTNHPRQENIIQIFQQGVAPGATPGANRVKANSLATIAQSCVSSGTHLTTQFPSHGLGEPVAYGIQTLAKGAAL